MLSDAKIAEYAAELYDSLNTKKVIEPLSERSPEITVEDAYQISKLVLDRRIAA